MQPSTAALLAWYDTGRRPLPWRANRDPYAVWLSEIILQQTRVDQGTAYWQRFVDRWPHVVALADAPADDVLKLWQGLGYYARARNLHRAAVAVRDRFHGQFPTTSAGLKELPGIGPYTAAAVASICFNEPVAAVDGNVQRVVSRFLGIDAPVDRPEGAREVAEGAQALLDPARPGDFNQAVMELGATVCTPHAPKCGACPLASACASGAAEADLRPVKAGRTRVLAVHWEFHVFTDGERVALRQRPEGGVWGGLWEFPSASGGSLPVTPLPFRKAGVAAPPMTHLLSHRKIEATFPLWVHPPSPAFPGELPSGWRWLSWEDASDLALPRLIDKALPSIYKAATECTGGLPTFGGERLTSWPESTK